MVLRKGLVEMKLFEKAKNNIVTDNLFKATTNALVNTTLNDPKIHSSRYDFKPEGRSSAYQNGNFTKIVQNTKHLGARSNKMSVIAKTL